MVALMYAWTHSKSQTYPHFSLEIMNIDFKIIYGKEKILKKSISLISHKSLIYINMNNILFKKQTYQSSQAQQSTDIHQHILHILQVHLLYNDLCKTYHTLNTAMNCQMCHYNNQLYTGHKNHQYTQSYIYTNQILFEYLLPILQYKY